MSWARLDGVAGVADPPPVVPCANPSAVPVTLVERASRGTTAAKAWLANVAKANMAKEDFIFLSEV